MFSATRIALLRYLMTHTFALTRGGPLNLNRVSHWLARVLVVHAAIMSLACADPAPSILDESRALIVHSTGDVSVRELGRIPKNANSRLLDVPDSVATLRAGNLRCLRSANVRVEYFLSRRHVDTLTILCRPIANVLFRGTPPLMLHGGPSSLGFFAQDPQGNAVSELQGTVQIDDTTVIQLSDGMISPKRTGATWVRIEVGDCSKRIFFVVNDTVASPQSVGTFHEYRRSFSLAREEYVALPLPRGWIGISARTPDSTKGAELQLGVHGGNCAKLTAAPNDLACIVDSTATALLQAGRTATTAEVYIRKLGSDSLPTPIPGKQPRGNDPDNGRCPWIVQ